MSRRLEYPLLALSNRWAPYAETTVSVGTAPKQRLSARGIMCLTNSAARPDFSIADQGFGTI